jgi:hypothetical protein
MQADHITFIDLHKWYSKELKSLGWLVLARSHGHHEKVWAYRKSIEHLLAVIETKAREAGFQGTVSELKIMNDNLKYILAFVDSGMKDSLDLASLQFLKECQQAKGCGSPTVVEVISAQFTLKQ